MSTKPAERRVSCLQKYLAPLFKYAMAKILFSAFSNVTWTSKKYDDSFVEGFVRSLNRCGNDVLVVRTNDYVTHPVAGASKSIKKLQEIEKIKAFNPDLIITLNNSLPFKEIYDITDCPIALYSADGPDFFSFPDLLRKHLERYKFFKTNENMAINLLRAYPNIRSDQLFDFGYATDFRAQAETFQDINISFLGSIPNYTYDLTRYFKHYPEQKDTFFGEFSKFQENVFSDIDVVLPNFRSLNTLETLAVFLITTKARFFTLSALTDLGLSIRGFNSFCDAGVYNHDILRCYNAELCVSIEQSEAFFNRSKISLNLPNARAADGFSWRVPDVLSSNSVLLSPKVNELTKLMKSYADLPAYESPEEARSIAIRLLNDDSLRKDLVLASQTMINDKCRFESKFKVMEQVFNLKLLSETEFGILKRLEPEDTFIGRAYKKVPSPVKRVVRRLIR
ncbi:MAG: glycosyltransferase family 1 protein [Alphaproteobacteria bacterium]|nr:MAG: glycosyltransferase family 1 protein [Alphaproteobacteria bacterium]